MTNIKVSLIIPILNEEKSLEKLINAINQQTFAPNEIIFVDGGSTDNSIKLLKNLSRNDIRYRIIEAKRASPGRGRNIGAESASTEWIAFTDAGIILDINWLSSLVKTVAETPTTDIVYGNYSPVIETFFELCAALAYVSPLRRNQIRERFIASSLLKKRVWEDVGGFPDLRAAEDLIFMDEVKKQKFKISYAPNAMVYWHLRPDLSSTFKKFVLYSKYNVWAGREWDWHYGILRQYLFIIPFVILFFFNNYWWITAIPIWFCARTIKRILPHRYEYRLTLLFNPIYFFSVMFIILMIDIATFTGWGKSLLEKKDFF